jgi:chitin synthase
VVEVSLEYLELEPIGLMFVVFFVVVMIIQLIGMMLHRWGTLSQIISTTKFEFCERKPKVWKKSAYRFVCAYSALIPGNHRAR